MLRLALVVALVAACKKQDRGPACQQIVDHMLEVTKQQLPGHGDQPLGDRKQMIDECEKRELAPAVRTCLVAAKSLAELAECRAGAKPAPTGSAAAPPPTDRAAATGP
jgi:hypothetical protein